MTDVNLFQGSFLLLRFVKHVADALEDTLLC